MPHLTFSRWNPLYAIELVHVENVDERRSLRVAYNSVFRKIYGYRLFESVTNLQLTLGRLTWEELLVKKSTDFCSRANLCNRGTLIWALRHQLHSS